MYTSVRATHSYILYIILCSLNQLVVDTQLESATVNTKIIFSVIINLFIHHMYNLTDFKVF